MSAGWRSGAGRERKGGARAARAPTLAPLFRSTLACTFCAFSAARPGSAHPGAAAEAPYLMGEDEVEAAAAAAAAAGATELCLQGGIHPTFTGATYLRLLAAAKRGAPGAHVHAFSPLEVAHGAATLGVAVPSFLARLRGAGLGSLPGTAAEVLRPAVRRALCPDKVTSRQWLATVRAAHGAGLRTTATLMFGHVDAPADWAVHLHALRALQDRTGGFTEFVPLPFVPDAAPGFAAGATRGGPTLRETLLVHAVARLFLAGSIDNIQVGGGEGGGGQGFGRALCGAGRRTRAAPTLSSRPPPCRPPGPSSACPSSPASSRPAATTAAACS